jgi:hypothetical protein
MRPQGYEQDAEKEGCPHGPPCLPCHSPLAQAQLSCPRDMAGSGPPPVRRGPTCTRACSSRAGVHWAAIPGPSAPSQLVRNSCGSLSGPWEGGLKARPRSRAGLRCGVRNSWQWPALFLAEAYRVKSQQLHVEPHELQNRQVRGTAGCLNSGAQILLLWSAEVSHARRTHAITACQRAVPAPLCPCLLCMEAAWPARARVPVSTAACM